MTEPEFIPFSPPAFGREEEQELIDTLRSGWVTTGPRTKAFEAEFARRLGVAHAVAVNSGTAALHLALAAGGIDTGDEVITSPITFPATANVVVHQRGTPVFVDVRPGDLNIDPDRVEAALSDRTRAIIPVDFAGTPCDMDAIRAIAGRRELLIVSDAAHSLGASFDGRPVGTLADVTAFSFYATKNITTGEGGMLVTDDERLADAARVLSLHGISVDAWKRYTPERYTHWETLAAGFKYNMSDLQAAIGLHQLAKLDGFVARRRQLMEIYRHRLGDMDEIRFLEEAPAARSARHLCVMIARTEELSITRDEILQALQDRGIGVGVHFRALHLHRYYRERFGFRPGMFPNAEYASDRVFSVPLHPGLDDGQVERIVGAVREVVTAGRRRRFQGASTTA